MSNVITEYDLEEMYAEMLDDNYGVVEIAGAKYYTSRVLKDTDPIAYHVGMSDYASFLMEDGYEVEGY